MLSWHTSSLRNTEDCGPALENLHFSTHAPHSHIHYPSQTKNFNACLCPGRVYLCVCPLLSVRHCSALSGPVLPQALTLVALDLSLAVCQALSNPVQPCPVPTLVTLDPSLGLCQALSSPVQALSTPAWCCPAPGSGPGCFESFPRLSRSCPAQPSPAQSCPAPGPRPGSFGSLPRSLPGPIQPCPALSRHCPPLPGAVLP